MLEALVDAVGDGPVVEQGGEDLLDPVLDVVQTLDVEEGLLLTGEGGVGQILGGGRGAHGPGDRGGAGLGGQAGEGVVDRRFQCRREGLLHDPAADARTGLGERRDVVDVQFIEDRLDALVQSVLGEKLAVGVGGGGESARHLNTQVE